ncbi:MAG: AAA family ATPase, partial [Acinetobacter sp.]|nr:AAA family ATPase [Acinetobacter sp.]
MKQATALNLLKSGVNVFLTGSAGAGKTYTLNQYIRYLRERNVAVAITASTGIAATHMNGRTIHSWAGIGIKDEMTTAELKRLKESRRQVREQIIKAQVLIIDEISMLHYKQFNLINQVLKYIKENDEPFGGLQLIVCGDFFQLPPVGKNEENNRNKFCFMSPSWVEANFTVCYLTEQHRQGNDLLSDILNAIRKQYIPKAHIDALLATMQQNIGDTFTHLYTHNINVDSTNDRYLREIDGEEKMFIAEMTGDEFLLKTLRASVRAPEELLLKKHAKVMFVKNHSDLYYSNGSLGEVIGFEADN